MPSLASVRASNAAYSPSSPPVAVFLGGTSGIGQGMAENFARYTNGNARIIICGRNKTAAEAIIASFPKPTVNSDSEPLHEFVYCDATLMKNVHATTKDLLTRLPKVNFVVVSPGYLSTKPRMETEEGIDARMALNYYARWAFIHDLIPLLRKANDMGEDAKVMSVLAAGRGGPVNLDDLALKNYSLLKLVRAVNSYNDLMMDEFAAQFPEASWIHVYPGVVDTPILWVKTHWILRPLNALLIALLYPFTVSRQECGEWMWHGMFTSEKGSSRRGSNGSDIGKKGYYGTPEAVKALWDHTVEVTNVSS